MRTFIYLSITLLVITGVTLVRKVYGQAAARTNSPDESLGRLWNNGIGHSSWDLALAPNERSRLLSLWNSIGEDLVTDENPLAGTYVKDGYNSGYFLRWSSRKGFIVIPYFDQNLITNYGYGKVNFVDESEIVFTSEKQLQSGRGLGKMPSVWTAIWNYLVPVDELKEFGNFHAGLGEYNEFNGRCCEFQPIFLATRIDRIDKPLSYPVPAKYKKFIKNPITGKIVSVGRKKSVKDWGYQGKLYGEWMEKAILVPVSISVGKMHGVRRNMLFRLIGEPEGWQYLQITSIHNSSAEGYVVRDISAGGKESYSDEGGQEKSLTPIRIGMKVTTSPVR